MPSDPRAALITGGAQGIGKAIARRFLAAGLRVLILDRDAAALAGAARDLGGGDAVATRRADVAREREVAGAVTAAVRAFGRLDAIVSNAGIGTANGTPVTRTTLAQWRRVLDANLTATFLLARHGAAHLAAAKGSLVTIASTRALMSEPHCEAYAASKGGLLALTHALAISLGPDVRANCISPGWIDVSGPANGRGRKAHKLSPADHGQHPVGRVGRPEDVAELALFLISPAAGFITGQNHVCDGGMTRKMIYR
jgi:NAD(P)-dependent dehydrogenase (short-subunit alcohol dehydrogenase family)